MTLEQTEVWNRIFAVAEPIPECGCFVYPNIFKATGYGQISIHKYQNLVHRVVYEILNGPIPKDLEIDHKCRVRSCCNPNHLELVTHKENGLRGKSPLAINARKTHCVRGHEFNKENTYWETSRLGTPARRCKICKKERERNRVRIRIYR